MIRRYLVQLLLAAGLLHAQPVELKPGVPRTGTASGGVGALAMIRGHLGDRWTVRVPKTGLLEITVTKSGADVQVRLLSADRPEPLVALQGADLDAGHEVLLWPVQRGQKYVVQVRPSSSWDMPRRPTGGEYQIAVAYRKATPDDRDALAAQQLCAEALDLPRNQASAKFEEALATYRRIRKAEQTARILLALGYLRTASGSHETAAGLFREALAIYRSLNDVAMQGRVTARLAAALAESGPPEPAIDAFAEAVRLLTDVRPAAASEFVRTETLLRSADFLLRAGHVDEAEGIYNRVRDGAIAPALKADALLGLASVQFARGSSAEAGRILDDALAHFDFRVFDLSAARLSIKLGQPERAVKAYRKYLEYFGAETDYNLLADRMKELAEAYRLAGDKRHAAWCDAFVDPPAVLQPNVPVAGALLGTESRHFVFTPGSGNFLRIELEAPRLQLKVQVRGREGGDWTPATPGVEGFDSEEGKLILHLAVPPGQTYLLSIAARDWASRPIANPYRLAVQTRDATAEDRIALEAQRIILEFENGQDAAKEKLINAAATAAKNGDLGWAASLYHRLAAIELSPRGYNFPAAVEYIRGALAIYGQLGDRRSQALLLTAMGAQFFQQGRFDEAMRSIEEARPLVENDPALAWEAAQEVTELSAQIAQMLGDSRRAGELFARARDQYGAIQHEAGAVSVGAELTRIQMQTGQFAAALGTGAETEKRARALLKPENETGEPANPVSEIEQAAWDPDANVWRYKGIDTGGALRNLRQALASPAVEALATVLRVEGQALFRLNQPAKALPLYEEALEIEGRAHALTLLAMESEKAAIHRALGDEEKGAASEDYAVHIVSRFHDGDGRDDIKAEVLFAKALHDFDRRDFAAAAQGAAGTAAAWDRIHDYPARARALSLLGRSQIGAGQIEDGISALIEALPILHGAGDHAEEAAAFSALMQANAARNPAIAIAYGKQAIALLQQVRASIQSLDPATQARYRESVEAAYRALAELLATRGRLPEAEEILGLLKQEEFRHLVRRDGAASNSVSLTAEEAEWQKNYEEITRDFLSLGSTRTRLLAIKAGRTAEEERQLDDAVQGMRAGNTAFTQFLARMDAQFGRENARVAVIKTSRAFLADLAQLPGKTAALYTLTGDRGLRLLLATPGGERTYLSAIAAADLNRKIAQFRLELQDPLADPRPLARELYAYLMPPALEADLKTMGATMLMWSLDGALRYLPVGALHDGAHWLAETYNLSVFTPASNARLKDNPAAHADFALFGVTEQHPPFDALPAVRGELESIGRAVGVTPEFDGQFTEATLRKELNGQRSVFHIASHFAFEAGDGSASYLLLGDGAHLTISELDSWGEVFAGVDLLTLSACNTATGSGDGHEFEGLGMAAQNQGAKAVMATLWSVPDESTGLLMRRFYELRLQGMSKAEALRRAQIELLGGAVKPGTSNVRSATVVGAAPPRAQALPGYTHPFYWAPFILIGNWK